MTPRSTALREKLLEMLIGALTGYLYGWLVGWAAVDPDLDWWAPLAFILALVGLLLGFLGIVGRLRRKLFGFLAGLYLAWILRTMILGEAASFAGTLIITVGTFLGWIMADSLLENLTPRAQAAALLSGFLAGNLHGLIGVLEVSSEPNGWVPVVVMTSAVALIFWPFLERRFFKPEA